MAISQSKIRKTHPPFFLARTLAPALVSSTNDVFELNIADASPVNPNSPGSFVERFIHSEVLKRFDDVSSAVHSHSQQVLAYTITDVPFKAVYHMAGFLGNEGISNFDIAEFYEPADSQDLLVRNTELGASLANTFADISTTSNPSFPDPPVVLMRGHGFTVAAGTVEQAVFFAYYSQSNAEAQTGGATLEHAFSKGGGAGSHYLGAQEGKDSWAANRPLISRS
jgi:ribulose-5-phosphate 4-epimerase/fuculose-1-phosphate aldolase